MKSLERMLSIVEVSGLATYLWPMHEVVGSSVFSPTGHQYMQHETFAGQWTTAARWICAVRGRAAAKYCSTIPRYVCLPRSFAQTFVKSHPSRSLISSGCWRKGDLQVHRIFLRMWSLPGPLVPHRGSPQQGGFTVAAW